MFGPKLIRAALDNQRAGLFVPWGRYDAGTARENGLASGCFTLDTFIQHATIYRIIS